MVTAWETKIECVTFHLTKENPICPMESWKGENKTHQQKVQYVENKNKMVVEIKIAIIIIAITIDVNEYNYQSAEIRILAKKI